MANPQDDWKIWLVVSPSKFLVPIWIAVLVVAVVVHLAVIGSPKYNFLAPPAAAAASVK
jgi:light-harvesting protein B-800-850 alpha chain